ncbi:conserved protein, unknown function [Hepatocystis sp. ex Piliocolobus tephrosceles]|nr:conserved protein, unknown function [Hepatocystis sp. ex Piliocolobus tephrosceles]
MNRNIEQVFTELLSDANNNDEDNNDSSNIKQSNLKFGIDYEFNFFDDKTLINNLGHVNFFKYTEYSLSSLYISDNNISLDNDPTYYKLINIITKATDVNNKYEWVDYYFKIAAKKEINILMPKAQNKYFIFREYIKPKHIEHFSILRKYEHNNILESNAKNKVNVKIVSEYVVHDTYKKIIKSFDYYLIKKVYTKAHIFHNKYGNSEHIIVSVLKHYQDENYTVPLYYDKALVQIKSYSTDHKYTDITQKNLLKYAEIFKPIISLRKVNYQLVEQINENIFTYA